MTTLTAIDWNDSVGLCAVQGVRQSTNTKEQQMAGIIRRTLRRLDRWTLTVFNPYYASDHRR